MADDEGNGEDGLAEGPEDDEPMSFFDHLAELRGRLLRAVGSLGFGFVACYVFVDQLTSLLLKPFSDAWHSVQSKCLLDPEMVCLSGDAPRLQNLSPFESVLVDIRIALIGGLFIAAPIIFYQVWMFIAPGLYRKERRLVVPFAGTSAVMFFAGAAFCYLLVLPIATEFLLEYGLRKDGGDNPVEIMAEYTYTDHIQYTTRLLLGFGLIFEFPLAVFFLAKAGFITHRTLLRHWKILVICFFIVGAFLTPPEPVSQVLMALPLCVLFFASIGVAYVVSKPEIERLDRLEAELEAEREAEEARAEAAAQAAAQAAAEEAAAAKAAAAAKTAEAAAAVKALEAETAGDGADDDDESDAEADAADDADDADAKADAAGDATDANADAAGDADDADAKANAAGDADDADADDVRAGAGSKAPGVGADDDEPADNS